jgi:hypothetical protein
MISLARNYAQSRRALRNKVQYGDKETNNIRENSTYLWMPSNPMGLAGAPSYSQAMAAGVLRDLIHQTCELYLDDILVFAQDDDEFIGRVREIFTLLRQSK